MMKNLENKSILFFCPKFFGYQDEIANKLRALGAFVDAYDERPQNDFFTKASIRINKNLVKRKIQNYYDTILTETSSRTYEYIFVVNIEAMLPNILEKLKKQNPKSQFILYMWDSLQNKKQTQEILPFFDKVFSFDKSDVQKIDGVRFRPLFFIDKYAEIARTVKHTSNDVCFIGTVHSDRYHLIENIKHQIDQLSLKGHFFLFFPNRILFVYKKLRDIKFFGARYSDFSFSSLSQTEIVNTIRDSKVILDIQHPGQTGLTMRTIEMIGADKKIITTNEDIRNYDLFNEENIMVIDRRNPVLDRSFFENPYKPLEEKLKFKYSIDGWLHELFLADHP